MQVGILKTDGGPHPAEKWARMTAWMLTNHLIQVDENDASPRAIEMREARDELNLKVYRVLKGHHDKVQASERAKIAEQGDARLSSPVDAAEHADIDAIVEAVAAEAKLHPELFAHFSKDETKLAVKQQLERDFGSVMHIERSWHADGHKIVNGRAVPRDDHDPRSEHVRAFRSKQAPGFAGEAQA